MKPKPYYERAGIQIFCGDARDILPHLSADVIVTDPPYGIPLGAAFIREGGTVVHSGKGISNETNDPDGPYGWIKSVPSQVRCIAFFLDRATACDGEFAARAAGFSAWAKFYLVKDAPPPTPRPTFVSGVEECLIVERERDGKKRVWNGTGYEPNYWRGMSPTMLGSTLHQFQKPIEPICKLVRCLSVGNEVILDPFIGSGTTLVAAKIERRMAIGIDILEENCATAVRRLSQEVFAFN